jgi:hypothetical protein
VAEHLTGPILTRERLPNGTLGDPKRRDEWNPLYSWIARWQAGLIHDENLPTGFKCPCRPCTRRRITNTTHRFVEYTKPAATKPLRIAVARAIAAAGH